MKRDSFFDKPRACLQLATNGSSGIFNLNDKGWQDESHGQFYEQDKPCGKACRGVDLLVRPARYSAYQNGRNAWRNRKHIAA